jgi:hypothetical protein
MYSFAPRLKGASHRREKMVYTSNELSALAKEYLATLDDVAQDEVFTTDRGFAEIGLSGFLDWLKARERKQKREESRKLRQVRQGIKP